MYIFSKSHKVDIKFAIMQHVSGIYYNRQRMQSIGNWKYPNNDLMDISFLSYKIISKLILFFRDFYLKPYFMHIFRKYLWFHSVICTGLSHYFEYEDTTAQFLESYS